MKTINKEKIYISVDNSVKEKDYFEMINQIAEAIKGYYKKEYGAGTTAKIEMNIEIFIPDTVVTELKK